MADEKTKVKELDRYELIEILDKLCDKYRVIAFQSDWLYQQVDQFQKQIKQIILERKNDKESS